MLQQQRGNGNEEGNPNGNVRTTVCVCVEGRMFAFFCFKYDKLKRKKVWPNNTRIIFRKTEFFFRQVCCYFAIGLACYKSIDWRRVFEWLPWLDGRYPGSLVNWIPWQVKMEATAKVKSRRIRPKSWTWGDKNLDLLSGSLCTIDPKDRKYGWRIASCAEIRFLASYCVTRWNQEDVRELCGSKRMGPSFPTLFSERARKRRASTYTKELVQKVESVAVESRRSVDQGLRSAMVKAVRQEIFVALDAWPRLLCRAPCGTGPRHKWERWCTHTQR